MLYPIQEKKYSKTFIYVAVGYTCTVNCLFHNMSHNGGNLEFRFGGTYGLYMYRVFNFSVVSEKKNFNIFLIGICGKH